MAFHRALSPSADRSLVKPFVYATAFEPSLSNQNITPATLVSDTRFILKRRFGSDWSPRNYEESYHLTVTVRMALEQSLNSASVRIGLACGLEPTIRTMHTLGVVSEVDEQPAMLLGAVGIPPIEMADATRRWPHRLAPAAHPSLVRRSRRVVARRSPRSR